MQHRHRAFTLIELLVVIAIIALLMGILIPALSRSRPDLNLYSAFNLPDVWSTTHLPLSDLTGGGSLHRRVARDRHRNNLFFDGHSAWLSAEENTSRYWCGVETP